MAAMKMEILMVNCLVRANDFSVISVLMVPIEYFLYYSTRGSMIWYQMEGKKETMIMVV